MNKLLVSLLLFPAAAALAQTPPATRLTTLHTFQNSAGQLPVGGLVEGEDGVFYGVTAYGGTLEGGTIFKVTAAGQHTVLHNFGNAPAPNETGQWPRNLVRAADGSFYGTAGAGGPSSQDANGVVFRITPSGAFSIIHPFDEDDGFAPVEVMLASDGNLYGATLAGGAHGAGTIYRLTPAGVYTVLHSFAADATEGGFDFSRLVEGPNLTLYGTAQRGGYTVPNIEGTMFSLTTSGAFNVRYRYLFPAGSPTGVVFGSDGVLYGTGMGGDGYRLTTAGDFTMLHRLFLCNCGQPMGAGPVGRLIQRANGLFYGVTTGGGTANAGTIYSMNATGVVVPLHSFNGTTDGIAPSATLVEGRDARFYGTTAGFNTPGTVFKFAVAPDAPTNVVAVSNSNAGLNAGEVRLSWDAVRGANSYELYLGTVSGTLNLVSSGTTLTATTFVFTGLTPGTPYFFAVVAVNEAGSSVRSAEVSANPSGPLEAGGVRPPDNGGGGSLDALLLAMLSLLVFLRVFPMNRARRCRQS